MEMLAGDLKLMAIEYSTMPYYSVYSYNDVIEIDIRVQATE